jgi:hypothetical protein
MDDSKRSWAECEFELTEKLGTAKKLGGSVHVATLVIVRMSQGNELRAPSIPAQYTSPKQRRLRNEVG